MNKVYKIKDKFLSYVKDYDVDEDDIIQMAQDINLRTKKIYSAIVEEENSEECFE